VHDWNEATGPIAYRFLAVGMVTFGLSSMLYLLLVRSLDTPLVRPLRQPAFIALALLVIGGAAFALVVHLLLVPGSIDISVGHIDAFAGRILGAFAVVVLASYGYSLAAALSAWRRATPGTAMRKKAGAFALAFGVRDAVYIVAIAVNILWAVVEAHRQPPAAAYALWSFGAFLYAALLGYGILRTQLFDLDLKVKVGIRRGTMAAIFVIAVFIAFQIASQYLNRNYGFVASGVTTGLLLFLSPRLNKLADRVSDAALPDVQPTSEYLAFKKLEVYRAAVESAVEGGGLGSGPERAMLDRLGAKLGLAAADAKAIEAEFALPGRNAPPRAAAA
jgi:hypothetical protein